MFETHLGHISPQNHNRHVNKISFRAIYFSYHPFVNSIFSLLYKPQTYRALEKHGVYVTKTWQLDIWLISFAFCLEKCPLTLPVDIFIDDENSTNLWHVKLSCSVPEATWAKENIQNLERIIIANAWHSWLLNRAKMLCADFLLASHLRMLVSSGWESACHQSQSCKYWEYRDIRPWF